MEWFSFKAADEYFGIETQCIHRVIDGVKVTPVPLVPSCHLGVMYYRGEVFEVIHVGSLLEQREASYNENSRIILLKWSSKKLALVPDHIIGLIWVEDTKVKQTVYTHREYTVRIITPDHIWKRVSELSYGPYKV